MVRVENVIVKKAKSFDQAFSEVKNYLRIKREIRAKQKDLRTILEMDDKYNDLTNDVRGKQRDQRDAKKRVLNNSIKAQQILKEIDDLKDEVDGQQLYLFTVLDKYREETGQGRLIDEESKTKFVFDRNYKVKEVV